MGEQRDSTSSGVPAVVTPGNYDGVHVGHRELVAEARRVADALGGLKVTALTFDPHPLHFMASDRAPPLLTTVERRSELLREAGADDVVVQRFDRALALLSPEGFVDDILLRQLTARAVVVGSDFRFGAKRAGDVSMLESLGSTRGYQVKTVRPVTLEGQLVSSSQVRAALMRGDVEAAARMLTRVHDIERRVLAGDRRGRTIGFPTANLELQGLLAPLDGVYAVSVRIVDPEGNLPADRLLGVANLGVRPTVGAGRSLEVHVLDFAGDLYGRTLRVGFVARLRGEVKFPDLNALKAQIAADVQSGRARLEACDEALLRWV